MKKKLGLALAGLAVSKEALALATTASLAAVALAPTLGFDPWTWVLGATGGTIAQAWIPSDKTKPPAGDRLNSVLSWLHGRKMHLINVTTSILLAGLGSEYIVRVFIDQKWTVPNIYIAAFMLSSLWPFIAHVAWRKALKWSES